MDSKDKKERSWYKRYLYTLAISSAVGLLFGLLWYANDTKATFKVIFVPVIIGDCIGLANITTFAFLGRRLGDIKNPILRFVVVCLAMILATAIGNEISMMIVNRFFFHQMYVPFSDGGQLIGNCGIGLLIGISIYLKEAKQAENELKLSQQEIKIMELHQLKTKAELETLQSKINPHFLYNSLNSIAGLIHEDAGKAEQMTINLSKLFRYSINTQGNNYSSVKEELEMVRTYLDIEKVRFGDKLNFEINADAESANFLIPRFLIQPLVENAIKHGTSKQTGQGIIQIDVVKNASQLEIRVHDNGAAFPSDLVSGYGLQSTHEKLNLLFPDAHEVQILNGKEKQVKIILKKLMSHEPIL